jgi:hypothetical protein
VAGWLGRGGDHAGNENVSVDRMMDAMGDDAEGMMWLLYRVMRVLRRGGLDVTGPRFKAAIMMIAGKVTDDPVEISKIADVWPSGGNEGVIAAMRKTTKL